MRALMIDEGVNFEHNWTNQPEAVKAKLVNTVLAPSTSVKLTFRLKQNTLPLEAKNVYPSLFWLVKLLSTINEAMQQPEAKKIKIMQVLVSANEVADSTPTHTATNSPPKSGSWRSEGLLDLLIEKVKCITLTRSEVHIPVALNHINISVSWTKISSKKADF